jgi:hypothetical protein
MTPEEKAELYVLCEQIVVEKDPQKFNQLIVELLALLEKKELRLGTKPKAN